jgi:hypothetical protein
MTLPPFKPVICLWADAHSPAAADTFDARELDTIHRPLMVATCGFLLRDDQFGVSIGGEWLGGNDFRAMTVVPRAMVVEVLALKRPARPRKARSTTPTAATDTPSHSRSVPDATDLG